MDRFTVTELKSLMIVHDPKGRKKEYVNRPYACYIITVKGEIRFTYRGGVLIARAGQPVFLPKGICYLNECLESAESYVFNFQTLEEHREPIRLAPISDILVREYYERIRSKTLSPSLSSTLSILEAMYSLSYHLFGAFEEKDSMNPMVRKALLFMRQHYGQAELTVGDVASHCCISEVYLRKLFESEVHAPPFRKLTEIRMERARQMVIERRPLKEIAESVGYSDVFQFSRAYKRHFGYAPSKEP